MLDRWEVEGSKCGLQEIQLTNAVLDSLHLFHTCCRFHVDITNAWLWWRHECPWLVLCAAYWRFSYVQVRLWCKKGDDERGKNIFKTTLFRNIFFCIPNAEEYFDFVFYCYVWSRLTVALIQFILHQITDL